MTKTTNNTPKLRFPGFTDTWEQRKLGDLVSFSKGSGYSKGDLKINGTPIILYGRLYTKYETVISEVDTFVDEKKGSVYSKGGEVIVPASGETAEDISIASVVEKAGILLGGDLNVITPPDDLDSAFLAISISNGKPHNDMAKMAQGKSVVHLHNTDLAKIDLPFPSHEEQHKISGFFSDIDNLITLHQRKLDGMKEYKKGLLQKMFPKKGETVPEIRFPGFTDNWEKCKLGDIADIKTGPFGTQLSAKEYTASGIPVINVKNIGTGCIQEKDLDYVSEGTAERLSDHMIQENDIVFGRKGAIGRHAIIRKTQNNWVQGSDCIRVRFKPGIVASYVNAQLQTANVIVHLSMYAYGSTMLTLTTDMINSIPLLIPEEAEQAEVAHVFSDIDNLITLHQRKLDAMKEYKKGLLQQMFV